MRAQDILASAGPQAEHIEALWWVTLALCAVVFAAVLFALAWALLRAPRGDPATPPDLSSLVRPERGAAIAVVAGVALSAAGLVFLAVASYVTDRRLATLGTPAVEIELTAHRWWWEARYQDADPSRIFTTANELHIPIGQPVLIRLKADDVIHSFWVPNLSGKKDLIPGRDATLTLQAEKPGSYRGQCAEFCGLQHAKMALVVFADPPEQYEAWAAAERKPAFPPAGEQAARGREG